jgi:hypothetical protein
LRVLRRFLLHVFVLGCVVSAAVSGRFSVRLILDGAISFAFVPAFVLGAFAIVYRMRTLREVPFGDAAGAFLAGTMPWLWWMAAVAAALATIAPRKLGPWIVPLELSAILPLVWSIRLDLHFFRDRLGRPARRAAWDVALQRAIAWTGIVTYFLGIAIWSYVAPVLVRWIG